MSPYLSVVIPAYNEETRLPDTLNLVRAFCDGKSFAYEVFVVDDGSTDGTATAVERAAASWPALRLLRNPGNRGKGYSVRHGMLEARGEFVLFSDTDLSAPIEETDNMLEKLEEGFDVAIGSRALRRELIGRHQSIFRETAGQMFNLAVRFATGLGFHDTQCGFKLFRHAAAQAIFSRQRLEGFGFDVEVLYLAKKLRFSVAEVPVRWNHSPGTKVRMLSHGLEMLADLWRIRWWDWSGKYESAQPPGVERHR